MLEGLRAGAVGAMVPFAAVAPQACYEVLAAWKDGDPKLSAEILREVETSLIRAQSSGGGPRNEES